MLQRNPNARKGPVAPAFAMLCIAILACSARAAPAGGPLGYDDARQLLNRTGFGATHAQIEHFAPLTREQAVRALLADTRTTAATTPPAWTSSDEPLRYPRPGDKSSDAERKAFQRQQVREGLELRGWWVGEMLATPSPLTERMTLFWHNHFVSSQQKVKLAELMYRQNVTLRANALGHFGDLLHAMARDPAMVIYLDSVQNRKGTPNENFAREVMELFTLGEGNYAEQDVKEAARAFTGWSLDRASGQFVFRPFIHDYGIKTVLGRSGKLDGDDVLDILLAQPQTAEFITRKLWREFVSPDPTRRRSGASPKHFANRTTTSRSRCTRCSTSDAFYAADNRGDAGQVAGGAGRRHAASIRSQARPDAAVRGRRSRHGTEPVLAAQRQGLAGPGHLDQFEHAARAQAVSRPAVPRRGRR